MCGSGSGLRRWTFSRREWLRLASRTAAGVPLGFNALSKLQAAEPWQGAKAITPELTPTPPDGIAAFLGGDPSQYRFTSDEDSFLEDLERACFQFFWDEVNPTSGLVKDRSQADGPDH